MSEPLTVTRKLGTTDMRKKSITKTFICKFYWEI